MSLHVMRFGPYIFIFCFLQFFHDRINLSHCHNYCMQLPLSYCELWFGFENHRVCIWGSLLCEILYFCFSIIDFFLQFGYFFVLFSQLLYSDPVLAQCHLYEFSLLINFHLFCHLLPVCLLHSFKEFNMSLIVIIEILLSYLLQLEFNKSLSVIDWSPKMALLLLKCLKIYPSFF